jgi:hypothetical protein
MSQQALYLSSALQWKCAMADTLRADPPAPDYSEDGVDLSLIRWFLSLTPGERLEFAERQVNEILAIRELNAK